MQGLSKAIQFPFASMRRARTNAVPATAAPWSCHHHANESNLEAYSEACGDWIVIAKTMPADHVNHLANADMIARAVNDYDLDKQLIRDLTLTLELCPQCKNLSFEAEQEANIVMARAKLATA